MNTFPTEIYDSFLPFPKATSSVTVQEDTKDNILFKPVDDGKPKCPFM